MKTKPHRTKKRSKKKKGKKGLSGAEQYKAAKKGLQAEQTKPIGIVLGLVGSSLAGHLIDKVPFLQPDESVEGFQIKKVIKPAALVLIGGTSVFATHGKKTPGAAFVNGLGWGFISGGAISGAKVILKKDLFAGLGTSPDASKASLETNYYKAQAQDLAKLLEQNRFSPNLPELSEGVNGLGAENIVSEFEYSNLDEPL
ncbi:MAG: hypothetical protein ACT4ON_13535 [Bacteroidota bacterium]